MTTALAATAPPIWMVRNYARNVAYTALLWSDGWNFPEACDYLNDASRMIINSYVMHYGLPWLGNINMTPKRLMYEHTPKNNWCCMWQHAPGVKVYNFTGSFVVPRYDEKLERLILRYNEAMSRLYSRGLTHAGSVEVVVVVERSPFAYLDDIYDRIEAIGGTKLNWS